MTEELSYGVTADAKKAVSEINSATTAIAKLSAGANFADKNLQNSERALAKAGTAAQKYAQSLQTAAQAAARFRSNTNLNNFTVFGKAQDPAIAARVPASFGMTTVANASSSKYASDPMIALNQGYRDTLSNQARVEAGNARVAASFSNMAGARYAMYDVARSLTVVSAATLGAAGATIKLSADYESLLVQVQRTSQTKGTEWQTLRGDLIDLSTQIPATMQDITSIATLAGQLGIASSDIDAFTESVVKFSATTDVSASSAAESFGRIAQLTGATGDQYDNLASSVYQVGITSVSTESDILSVAQQIAVSGRQAGFATEQTVALASALASVGVAPERARGSIQRVFNIITNSVDNGSKSLDIFAKYSNQSASDFAATWKGDPQTAFLSFLQGLGAAGTAGENMNNVLASVGISAVRDTDALKRLAQNTEVYTTAIDQASQGWSDGSLFATGYSQVAETLNSKLTTLANTLKAILVGIQDNTALKDFVSLLQNIANVAKSLLSNKVGQFFAGVALFAGVLVGALALLGAGVATAYASLLAMVYALTFLKKEVVANVGIFDLLKISILQATGAMAGETDATIAATVATGGFTNALRSAAVAGGTVSKVVTGIKASLISTGVGLAIIAGMAIVTKLWSDHQAEAAAKAAQLEAATTSLSAAIEADTAKYNALGSGAEAAAAGYTAITREVTTTSDAMTNTSDTANTLIGSNITLKESVDGVTSSVKDETIALGALSEQAFINSAAKSLFPDDQSPEKQAKKLKDVQDVIGLLGIDMKKLNDTTSRGDTSYLDEINTKVQALNDNYSLLEGPTADQIFAGQDLVAAYTSEGSVLDTLTGKKTIALGVDSTLGSTMAQTTDQIQAQTDATTSLADGLFDVINAQSGIIDATYNLGSALQTNGASFDTFSVGGRANIAALSQAISAAATYAGSDTALFSSSVEQMISQLEAAGATGVRNLKVVQAALAIGSPTGVSNAMALATLVGQVSTGYGDAAKASEKTASNTAAAAKQARTLKDYVSDLSGVMKDAFDFRFGFANSQDDTSKALRKIGDSLKDAADKARDLNNQITELNATLAGLSADRSILQYQLSIATEYGDTLRVQAILAELDKNAADTAKSQADLTDTTASLAEQQDYLTQNLDGTSVASEDQRKMVQDLLSAYEDQIAAYAKTGASQQDIARYSDTLKTKFQDQLRALGYNTDQVQKYVAAFDDLKRIIDQVPRNLTVSTNADTTPAQTALDEFFAKNADRSVNANVNYTSSGNGEKEARKMSLLAQIAGMYAQMSSPGVVGNYNAITAIQTSIIRLSNLVNSGAYAKGGKAPAGWALVGEEGPELVNFSNPGYVYTSSQTQQMLASARGGSGGSTTNIVVGNSPGSTVVDLSAGSIQRIAQAVQPLIELDGNRIAKSTNRSNKDFTRTGSK